MKKIKDMSDSMIIKELGLDASSSDSEDDLTWFQNAKTNSSCFFFHKNSRVRKLCLMLAESPETLQEYYRAEKEGTLDTYAADNKRNAPVGLFAAGKTSRKSKQKNPSKVFEDIILVLIILSSILLAIDNPLYDPKSKMVKIIGYIDVVFTVMFTIEASIKIIAKGFMWNTMGPIEPYIRNSWNMLDFFVVTSALVDLIFLIGNIDVE